MNSAYHTVVCVVSVDVLVTTLIVDDGVAVTLLLLLDPTVVSLVASLSGIVVPVPLLLVPPFAFDVDDCVVVSVDVDAGVVLVFGSSESTTPIGPDKSISLSGHDNSSG